MEMGIISGQCSSAPSLINNGTITAWFKPNNIDINQFIVSVVSSASERLFMEISNAGAGAFEVGYYIIQTGWL